MPIRGGSALTAVAMAYAISSMGDQVALVALTLRFYEQGASAVLISALVVVGVLPIVVIGPLAAPLIDRVESRRLVTAVALVQAAVVVVVALTDHVGVTLLLVAALGAGLAVVSPALLLLVPAVVGEERVAYGYGRLEAFRAVGNVLGPALAGILVAAFGSRGALLIDAVSFVLMAMVVTAVAVRREPVSGARAHWSQQVREGVVVLGRNRMLVTAVSALAAAVVFTATMSTARVFFAREDVGTTDVGYGLLLTAHAVGMVAASVLLAPRVPVAAQPRVLAGAGLLMGVALTVVAVLPVLAVALVGFVCTGIANALQNLAVRNLIHAEVPAEVRGRAFACASALLNGANLSGTALGGPAVVVLGGATSLLVAGLGAVVATLAAAPVLLRRGPTTS
ncbi:MULTISPECIES: MFS transporter [unclassified Micromonospora]|uniref:MFS transporter n=1 Tax=unclassified Micromonospora TaxID=2617518 RepID=UPI00103393C1|nr:MULTISPECIES: MFS transporter [unclassified Micromonospora]QKW15022.1 MFS transporter [Verrucosispora sp. NA02020]TBL32065.1 MFS transporter [Verrucosispora sp. SN26_14.1]